MKNHNLYDAPQKLNIIKENKKPMMTKQQTIILDEVGDLSATPGSRSWAIAVKNKVLFLVDDRRTTEKTLVDFLEILEKHSGYKQLENENGKPFENILEFVNAKYPFGLDGDERIKERCHSLADTLKRVWSKASEADRNEFLEWVEGGNQNEKF